MPVESNSHSFRFASGWIYRRTIPGYAPSRQRGTFTSSLNADTTEYNHKIFDQYTLIAGGTQIVDLRQFVSEVSGESVTASKVLTLELKAMGDAERNILLTNTGTETVTVLFAATVGE